MKLLTLGAGLGLFAGIATAHMEMKWPPPFRSKFNPNAAGDVDYSMTSPLDASGSNFPCKGYLNLVGTPKGKSVVTWQAGHKYNMTITGSANHMGGSCQASLSQDKGKTWKVIHSYIGNCPPQSDSNWEFTLPDDTPSGDMLFAWSWFNNVGNREMYMNCASVTVASGGKKKRSASDSLASRPDMFVANVGGQCTTLEGYDVLFPNPGPDVDNVSKKTHAPGGSCGSSAAGGGGSGGGSSESAPSSAPGGGSASAPTSGATGGSPSGGNVPSNPGGVFITNGPTTLTTALATSKAASQAQSSGSGIVITVPSGQPTSGAQPTSNAQATSKAQPTPEPQPTSGEGQPISQTQPVSGAQPTPGDASGVYHTGLACTNEGAWNCIGGTQFQRCASGMWSPPQAMAGGVKCKEGVSDDLVYA